MADDLQNYKLQLQQVSLAHRWVHQEKLYFCLHRIVFCLSFQVEAALLTDPQNGELLKLKQDLEEVIDLTKDLIRAQQEAEQKKSAYVEPASTRYFEGGPSSAEKKQSKPTVIWKVGDKCSAKWIEDGQ